MPIHGRFYCVLCGATGDFTIDTEWGCRYGFIDVEDAICPKHEGVGAFLDEHCPGCVEGWPDCELQRRIDRGITDDDRESLLAGRCPGRTNGTFALNASGVSPIDTDGSPCRVGGASIVAAYDECEESE
jgi:hypothetical protein